MKDWPIGFDAIEAAVRQWRGAWSEFTPSPVLDTDADNLSRAWQEFVQRMGESYPFFHPNYAGQMLKPPHPVAMAGYLAAMFVNSNNHALDGGPTTSAMEKEVVADLGKMFGFPAETIGHLTSGGTVANLEALWVGREVSPGTIAFSADAHYTHGRMAGVLGVTTHTIPVDAAGRMDIAALRELLEREDVGTVVATAGTTGLGVVDPIADLVALRSTYGFRLHVDAAYGGFFRLLMDDEEALSADVRRHFRAIEHADSVVVDPHKHGLQPYGCGAVLFRDPAVGKVYRHDSPYTYFTSDELHLGEISLECSRAGASAAALWLTLRAFPLTYDGLGRIVRESRIAARTFYEHINTSDVLHAPVQPELDIVVYHPEGDTETVDRLSGLVFKTLMSEPDPVFLSLYRMPASRLGLGGDGLVRVLRSTLMKPEHADYAGELVQRIESAVRSLHTLSEKRHV